MNYQLNRLKKLDQYILKSFIGPFFAILIVVLFILVMQFLWLYIDELVGKGLSFLVILEFLGWGSATILPLALPLATLLSSVMTLGTLGENYELTAIKAAGISLMRILAPLIVVNFFIAIAAFFVSNDLIPVAYNKIYTLRDDILRTKEEINIPRGTFYDGIEGYILRIEDKNKRTDMMYDVMVYNHTKNKGNLSLTLADSALMSISKDKTHLSFILFNGCNYEETNTRQYRDTTYGLQHITFQRQELLIPLENYSFEKSDSTRFSDEAKSMNLQQLNHGKDSIGTLNYDTRKYNTNAFLKNGNLRYASQLDTAATPEIRPNFQYENIGVWKTNDAKKSALQKAKTSADEMYSTMNMYGREVYHHVYMLRRIDEEIYKKFALAIACFLFFFIGAPLGALIRKGGIGTPAIISVLFFVFYWVIDISGVKLARDGAVSPAIGVFTSSYVLLPIGMYLTWRAINDASIISMDNLKNRFRKIKAKTMGIFKKTKIVYMGTPEFAVAPLDALINSGHNIVGVVTVADKASGRGLRITESPVKKYALEHNIPILQPKSLKAPEFLTQLQAWNADLFVVVAFRLLPKEVWSMPRLGAFNLHAALLPQYRGAAPINWAIINGEKMTGVTTFMIDDGVDTGQIMLREQCKIEHGDTAGDLHDKLMELGSELVVNTADAIIENNVEFRLQKTYIQGSEVLKPAPKITRELCKINWNKPTLEVYNLIRGLSPYPAAYTEFVKDGQVQSVKIFITEELDTQALTNLGYKKTMEPGTILSDEKSYLLITTADGAIKIKELQLAGKRRMDINSFLVGFREPTSYKIQ